MASPKPRCHTKEEPMKRLTSFLVAALLALSLASSVLADPPKPCPGGPPCGPPKPCPGGPPCN
jgi:hypothetical protein